MSTRYHFNRPVGGAVTLPQKYTKNREEDLTIIRPQKIKQTNTKRRKKKKKKIMVNRDVSMNRRQWRWTSNECNIFCFCWSEKMCGDCNHGKAGVVLREVTIHGAAFINERLQMKHPYDEKLLQILLHSSPCWRPSAVFLAVRFEVALWFTLTVWLQRPQRSSPWTRPLPLAATRLRCYF